MGAAVPVTRSVSNLPRDLRGQIEAEDLIVFDGICVLCTWFFHFVLRHDQQRRFRFATAQSPLGQSLYRALALPTDAFETNLVIIDGQIHTHMDAVAAVLDVLGGRWRILAQIRVAPKWIKDRCYRMVATNRYRLFGRRQTCVIPDAALRARFLPGGWEPS